MDVIVGIGIGVVAVVLFIMHKRKSSCLEQKRDFRSTADSSSVGNYYWAIIEICREIPKDPQWTELIRELGDIHLRTTYTGPKYAAIRWEEIDRALYDHLGEPREWNERWKQNIRRIVERHSQCT